MILNPISFSPFTSITYNSMYKEAAHTQPVVNDGHLSSLANNRTQKKLINKRRPYIYMHIGFQVPLSKRMKNK